MSLPLNFPVEPHVRKYLDLHLGTSAYVLTPSSEVGRLLFHLLRRQLKGKLHHAKARARCTKVLELDLRNFPAQQYGLRELTNYTICAFNDSIDEKLKQELYVWIRAHVTRTTTIREVILDFMAGYDLTEEDIQFETLRKAVQRNVRVTELKKRRSNLVVNLSRKKDDLSRKKGELSREKGDLSRYAAVRAVCQEFVNAPTRR